MISPEKSIKLLAKILKVLAFLAFTIAVIYFIFSYTFLNVRLSTVLIAAFLILNGIINLSLSRGLSEEKYWAWCSSVLMIIISSFFGILFHIFGWTNFKLVELFICGSMLAIYVFLLAKSQKIFLHKPKEKIAKWFSDGRFLIVIGIYLFFIIFLISGAVYYQWYLPRQNRLEQKAWEDRKLLPIQIPNKGNIEEETKEWLIYKGEKTHFSLKYPDEFQVETREKKAESDIFLATSRAKFLYTYTTIADFSNYLKITISEGKIALRDVGLYELISMTEEKLQKDLEDYGVKYLKEEFIIDNVPAVGFAFVSFDMVEHKIFFEKDEDIYYIRAEFDYNTQKERIITLGRILATFRFIN